MCSRLFASVRELRQRATNPALIDYALLSDHRFRTNFDHAHGHPEEGQVAEAFEDFRARAEASGPASFEDLRDQGVFIAYRAKDPLAAPTATPKRSPPSASWDAVWGSMGVTAKGVLTVPNFFLRYHWVLGISDKEALLMLKILTHKWDATHPYLLNSTLADYMGGIENRNVQALLKGLEDRGLLNRVHRKAPDGKLNLSTVFDLTPLFAKLKSFMENPTLLASAKEAYRAKKEAQSKRARQSRAKPTLRVVGGQGNG